MKKKILTFSLIVLSITVNCQVVGGKYNDLFDKFILGEYQDCLDDALKYTEKDKTRREAEPYLYASMVFMKFYNDPDYVEFDKDDLLKDALKYAAKFVKYDEKDEESDLLSQNFDPLVESKKLSVELADYFYVEENYRKSAYFLKKYYKVQEIPELLLTIGNCQILSRNTSEGERNITMALEQLKSNNAAFKNVSLLDVLTAKSFKDQVEFLKANDEKEKANDIINLSAFYFKKDPQMAPLFN
jgi:hypothetical protein